MIKLFFTAAILSAFLLAGCVKAPDVYKLPKNNVNNTSGSSTSSVPSSHDDDD